MPPVVAVPNILTDPGFLWGSVLGTAEPTHTSSGGKFSDTVPAAWLPLGATVEGTTLNYSTTVEPVRVAELADPVAYFTTERQGSVAFNLANYTLTNIKRALNGGMAALTATGTAGAEVTRFSPPTIGNELRSQILWESTDGTVRILIPRVFNGGEMSMVFQKAPTIAAIPFMFNMELPAGSTKPFEVIVAGTTRV